MEEENQTILKEDLNYPRRRRALSKKKMQAIHRRRLHLLPQRRYKQCNEENFIIYREDESNAGRHSSIVRYKGGESNAQ